MGNRLAQIIDGDTTAYHYDAANRLAWVSAGGISQTYTFDANGNLLATGALTNSWDAANRLVEAARSETAIQPLYNGLGHRVGQTTALTTTYFALDVVGLPEVIHTGGGDAYLHLPGVIVAESAGGEVRYLLSDGLGSIRQAVDEAGAVVAYHEYDPYGNPAQDGGDPYGFTGEWWQSEVGLLHLRARWYWPQAGVFLSWDAVESEPPYQYVRGNVVNRVDPSGKIALLYNPCGQTDFCTRYFGHEPIVDKLHPDYDIIIFPQGHPPLSQDYVDEFQFHIDLLGYMAVSLDVVELAALLTQEPLLPETVEIADLMTAFLSSSLLQETYIDGPDGELVKLLQPDFPYIIVIGQDVLVGSVDMGVGVGGKWTAYTIGAVTSFLAGQPELLITAKAIGDSIDGGTTIIQLSHDLARVYGLNTFLSLGITYSQVL